MPQIAKSDLRDADIVDAVELLSDGALGVTSPFYGPTTVTSTTSGTKTVVVPVDSGGEGLLDPDHTVKAGDKAIISGTSGGAGDGTFTVATVPSETTFTIVESIGTSTGGSVTFQHKSGSLNVGLDSTNLISSSKSTVQDVVGDMDLAMFLDIDPSDDTQYDYSATRSGGVVTNETWVKHSNSHNIKTIDYTRSGGVVTQQVTKVYKPDGTTVAAQTTEIFTRSGGVVTSSTKTRDV